MKPRTARSVHASSRPLTRHSIFPASSSFLLSSFLFPSRIRRRFLRPPTFYIFHVLSFSFLAGLQRVSCHYYGRIKATPVTRNARRRTIVDAKFSWIYFRNLCIFWLLVLSFETARESMCRVECSTILLTLQPPPVSKFEIREKYVRKYTCPRVHLI